MWRLPRSILVLLLFIKILISIMAFFITAIILDLAQVLIGLLVPLDSSGIKPYHQSVA